MTRALAIAALFLTGCPGVTRPLEKPTASFRGVSITSAGLAGISARAGFTIHNPNSIGLPLRAVDWALSIGDSDPVRGRFTLSETIPARGSAPVEVDLAVPVATGISIGRRLARGERTYRIQGTLHFQTRLTEIAVSFDHSGAVGDL